MIRIQQEDFDAGELARQVAERNPTIGAVVSFVGLVRDMSEGTPVTSMTLEHYPGMTEKALEKIVYDAGQRWNLMDTVVIHRVGELKPGDQIVLVVTAGAHRHDAFQACEFVMDYLKTQAPFWKKEQTGDQTRWVEAHERDSQAAERWNDTE